MKTFVIVCLILVVLAGVVFFFGWIQILLPAETYAVIFTKTGGYDEHIVRPGEFTWRWERLIPTNMEIYTYTLQPQHQEVSFEAALPSADLYSAVLPENPDFKVSGQIVMEFAIRPDSLPTLVAEQKLRPDTLKLFYTGKAEEIADLVRQNLTAARGELLPGYDLERGLQQEIWQRFPELDILNLRVKSLRLPDLRLYELARESYGTLLQTRDRSRNAAVASLAEDEVRAENLKAKEVATLQSLREYGKLLNEYPVLLKAMYVQKLSGDRVITIPEFDLSRILESDEDG